MSNNRWFILSAALALAACSSDPGSGTPIELDTGTNQNSQNNSTTDMGDSNANSDSDAGTPDPDGGSVNNTNSGTNNATTNNNTTNNNTTNNNTGVYVGTGDPYQPGGLTVVQQAVGAADDGPPVDAIVMAPDAAGTYPVIVFQHGFVLDNSYYTTMLEHVTSHGFVVIAPQMYTSGVLGAPSTDEEAADARLLYDWSVASIGDVVDVDVDTTLFGLAGHSRGAKVLYKALEAGFTGAVAAAGVDPVDGDGSFLSPDTAVTEGGLDTNVAHLFIGAELSIETTLGQSCAPAGDNHEAFYAAADSPAYWAFAEDYGHLDMLNDQTPDCGLTCSACVEGPDDDNMRRFSAGQLVAFFRMELQGDQGAESFLTGGGNVPLTAQFMNK